MVSPPDSRYQQRPVMRVLTKGLVILGDGESATGEDDTSLLNGLAWMVWMLSWLGAIISVGLGVVLGSLRGIARHRTRSA